VVLAGVVVVAALLTADPVTFVAEDDKEAGFFTRDVEGTLMSLPLPDVLLPGVPSPPDDGCLCLGLIWELDFGVSDLPLLDRRGLCGNEDS
jgi:hypothetical protein